MFSVSNGIVFAVLLVYIGFTTAVPSPVAEDSPAADTAKSSEAQPVKRYDTNEWDLPHHIQCKDGEALNSVRSAHDNYKEDRWFDFECRSVAESAKCTWTDYVNWWDEPISFMCPQNEYMGGIQSYHDNGAEDRRFKFQCCRSRGDRLKTRSCFLTDYVNDWDGPVDYTAPPGAVFTGMASVHDNGREDRRYKFLICKLYSVQPVEPVEPAVPVYLQYDYERY